VKLAAVQMTDLLSNNWIQATTQFDETLNCGDDIDIICLN
jgi:hypothetical protein